jgi:hypothetical protein
LSSQTFFGVPENVFEVFPPKIEFPKASVKFPNMVLGVPKILFKVPEKKLRQKL